MSSELHPLLKKKLTASGCSIDKSASGWAAVVMASDGDLSCDNDDPVLTSLQPLTLATGQASYLETVLNVTKTCMGTGCLALSYACAQGGLVFFMSSIVLISFWNVVCAQRLIRCLQYLPASSLLRQETQEFNKIENENTSLFSLEKSGHRKNESNDSINTYNSMNGARGCENGTATEHVVSNDQDLAMKEYAFDTDLDLYSLPPITAPPPRGTSHIGQLAWYAFGPFGLQGMDIMMCLLFLGIIVAYMVGTLSFLADTPISLGPLLDAIFAACIMGFVSLVPDLGHLSVTSIVGLSVLLASFLVIAGYGFVSRNNNEWEEYSFSETSYLWSIPLWPRTGLTGISEAFGVIVFGFGVVPLTFNYRSSMTHPHLVVSALGTALSTVTVSYTIMGAGLLILYPHLTGDLLHELPKTGFLPTVTRLAMVLVLLVTAPLIVVVCGELLEGKLCHLHDHHHYEHNSQNHVPTHRQQRAYIRFGICAAAGLIAVVLPQFVQILSLVGSACVGTISFCLPPLLHWKLCLQSRQYSRDLPVQLSQQHNRPMDQECCEQMWSGIKNCFCREVLTDLFLLVIGVAATIASSFCMLRELTQTP